MLYTILFSIIGFAMGGLGGAFGGFLIGSLFDSIRNNRRARRAQTRFNESRQQYYNNPEQFEEQLLTLIGYVAKADNNRLLQSEFDYCKQYFQKTFPHSDISQLMLKFRDILNADDTARACQDACEKIRQYATIHEKMAILQCLFGFATADGNAHQQELEAIRQISGWCGVDNVTYEALKMMYLQRHLRRIRKQQLWWRLFGRRLLRPVRRQLLHTAFRPEPRRLLQDSWGFAQCHRRGGEESLPHRRHETPSRQSKPPRRGCPQKSGGNLRQGERSLRQNQGRKRDEITPYFQNSTHFLSFSLNLSISPLYFGFGRYHSVDSK